MARTIIIIWQLVTHCESNVIIMSCCCCCCCCCLSCVLLMMMMTRRRIIVVVVIIYVKEENSRCVLLCCVCVILCHLQLGWTGNLFIKKSNLRATSRLLCACSALALCLLCGFNWSAEQAQSKHRASTEQAQSKRRQIVWGCSEVRIFYKLVSRSSQL